MSVSLHFNLSHWQIQKLKGGHDERGSARSGGGAPAGPSGRAPCQGGQGAKPPKDEGVLEIMCRISAELFEYFYHVYMLLQRGMWPYSPLHMTRRGEGMAGLPPWIRQLFEQGLLLCMVRKI